MDKFPSTTYGKHPDEEFVKMFTQKPYQGQHPSKASLIILGYDANYSEQVRNHREFFALVKEYHSDGVMFWKKYGVHHPFLHPNYPFHKGKDGVRYHKVFSQLGFDATLAEKISFTELLNIPTVGIRSKNKQLFRDMLQKEHLLWLEDAIFSGNNKIVLLSPEFFTSYLSYVQKKFKVFQCMTRKMPKLTPVKIDNVHFYNGYHFSSSHIFAVMPQLKETIKAFI